MLAHGLLGLVHNVAEADIGANNKQEWKEHLRSAIHPSIFAGCYLIADFLASILHLSAPYRAQLLLAAPKVLQAVIAAIGDYYTWRLAEVTYGIRSLAPAAALVVTVANPWQWFCSTRTFSNSLETTLTIVAFYNWPWHWSASLTPKDADGVDAEGLRQRKAITPSHGSVDETTRLRRALFFAALATILRPTNVLIWAVLVVLTLVQSQRTPPAANHHATDHTKQNQGRPSLSKAEILTFWRESLLCGGLVLSLSAIVDRLFYQTWTFPAWNFLKVNVFQSIAGFYGNNNWHYYLSEGYPLLLTTALPFALTGMYRSWFSDRYRNMSQTSRNTLSSLTTISLFVPAVLSLISHKEVRFIYPLLPGLHVLAAHPIASFFASAFDTLAPYSQRSQLFKRFLLAFLLLLNLSISLYTATIHNSGLVNITHYLRSEFETFYLHPTNTHNMTIGFLMPCHSTPWRSHLQYPPSLTAPGIDAWALTCEPPLNLTPLEKSTYLDEADLFYLDPSSWLKRHMSRNPPVTHSFPAIPNAPSTAHHDPLHHLLAGTHKPRRVLPLETHAEEYLWRDRGGRRPWPEYLVFFEQLEPQMKRLVGGGGSGYAECERVWNSRWHDDWRRRGAVVVWCLYPERRKQQLAAGPGSALKLGGEKVGEGARLRAVADQAANGGWGVKQRPLVKPSVSASRDSWADWARRQVGLKEKRKRWFWEGWFGGEGRGGNLWNR